MVSIFKRIKSIFAKPKKKVTVKKVSVKRIPKPSPRVIPKPAKPITAVQALGRRAKKAGVSPQIQLTRERAKEAKVLRGAGAVARIIRTPQPQQIFAGPSLPAQVPVMQQIFQPLPPPRRPRTPARTIARQFGFRTAGELREARAGRRIDPFGRFRGRALGAL